jgi:hypothetical protein
MREGEREDGKGMKGGRKRERDRCSVKAEADEREGVREPALGAHHAVPGQADALTKES